MTALTEARDTRSMGPIRGRLGNDTGLIVKDGEVLWKGALLMMDENGEVIAGAVGLSKNRKPLGRCPKTLDNTADGELTEVEEGSFHWIMSSADANDVTLKAYALDDQTVTKTRHSASGTAQVNTITPTAVNDTHYQLSIRVDEHGEGEWETYLIAALGDGTATATEICDDLRTMLATIDQLTGVVTGSGTTTLVLTGADGVRFEVSDTGAGVLTNADTTPGVYIDRPFVGNIAGFDSTGVFVHTAR